MEKKKGEIFYEDMGSKRSLKINWLYPDSGSGSNFSYRQLDEVDSDFTFLDKENKEFFQALEMVKNTNQIFYLTGKAGTGKTTFLKYLKKKIEKNTIVVAFTGVAAINAGGVTINSFFQIPPSPFLPNDKRLRKKANSNDTDKTTIFETFKYSKPKKELLRKMELLIIDEISMVRADLLDVIDNILKTFGGRNPQKPFGGIQVVLIGDTFQLPPIEGSDWNILNKFYDSPFFFSSTVIKTNPPIYIELQKIYRQKEIEFIDLLNRIRINQITTDDLNVLNNKVKPISENFYKQNYISLCAKNDKVNQINQIRLSELNTPPFCYSAEISGEFPESLRPTENELLLKVGAQVMFIKNSSKYFNGKIGKIFELSKNAIKVQVDDDDPFEISLATWSNIKYTYNKDANKIDEEIIGKFSQYPLKLAWAVTVHKSQGLTFEKVIADLGEAFAPGQVYVALSRCTSLNGLVLSSPIPRNAIRTHPKVIEFAQLTTPESLINEVIQQGKADDYYQKSRNFLSNNDFDNAFQSFISALKYRNDIETENFKRYIKSFYWKLKRYKSLYEIKKNNNNILIRKTDELNFIIENQITKQESFLNKISDLNNQINQLENIISELKSENIFEKNQKQELLENKKLMYSTLNKIDEEKNEILKRNFELETENNRLRKLSWFDKLLGKK